MINTSFHTDNPIYPIEQKRSKKVKARKAATYKAAGR